MSNKITLHMPGKIERLGIRTHGLVKCPITVLPNGSELCYLRDYMLTTRAGKVIPLPYSEAEKELGFAPRICPRPFLYQHPLAQLSDEDEDGNDWSGYVVFYQYVRNNRGYLNNFIGAFTPDDNSQGLLFQGEFSYFPPLIIGGIPVSAQSVPPVSSTVGELSHVSKDGRYRAKGRLPSFSAIDVGSAFFEGAYFFTAYSLSGDAADGVYAYEQPINEPVFFFEKATSSTSVSSEYFPVEEVRYTGQTYKYGGSCENVVESRPVYKYGDAPIANLTNTVKGRSKLPIDAYVDDTGVASYLYCSYELDEEDSQVSLATIVRDDLTWGADCSSAYVVGGKVPYRDWEISSSTKSQRYSKRNIKAELSGNSSTLVLDWDMSLSKERTVSFAGNSGKRQDEVITNTVGSNYVSTTVTLDGVPLYSHSMAAQIGNGPRVVTGFSDISLMYATLPKVFRDNTSGLLTFSAGYQDASHVTENREDYIIEVCAGMIKLADGIHAFCVFTSAGKLSDRSNQSLMSQKLVIGRIFGFGVTKAGFEIPESDWEKKLYAAYDPVSKTISDIYTHPVFYQ